MTAINPQDFMQNEGFGALLIISLFLLACVVAMTY